MQMQSAVPMPTTGSLTWTVVLIMASMGAGQSLGCCCSTPSDPSVSASQKVVSGCKQVRCSDQGIFQTMDCDYCSGTSLSQECRFCAQRTHHTCGLAVCAQWCKDVAPHCNRYMACVGCESCSGHAAPPPSPAAATCAGWCEAHPAEWTHKCNSFDDCKACANCGEHAVSQQAVGTNAVTTMDSGDPAVTGDMTSFFDKFGVPSLPLLDVQLQYYSHDHAVHTMDVKGATTKIAKGDSTLNLKAMHISWEHIPNWHSLGSRQRRFVLLMDIDYGGRSSASGAEPGPLGPRVQGMWTECKGSDLASCQTLIPYEPPAHERGTDRYVFVLMQQPGIYLRDVGHTKSFAQWDFSKFLQDNWPEWWAQRTTAGGQMMCPILAYNFFYVSSTREEVYLDPRRQPAFADPPPPLLAWEEPSPPPPPPDHLPPTPPPRDAWWGGNERHYAWDHSQGLGDQRVGTEAPRPESTSPYAAWNLRHDAEWAGGGTKSAWEH